MWWNLAPIIIAICSIMVSIYVFKVKKNKRYFWSSIALSGVNLLGGFLFTISINVKIGLVLLIIPVLIILYRYLNDYKNSH